jgi:hypothetical protein
MPNEMQVDAALFRARIWILTAVMASHYAERSITSLAERANLLAKHANNRCQSAGKVVRPKVKT